MIIFPPVCVCGVCLMSAGLRCGQPGSVAVLIPAGAAACISVHVRAFDEISQVPILAFIGFCGYSVVSSVCFLVNASCAVTCLKYQAPQASVVAHRGLHLCWDLCVLCKQGFSQCLPSPGLVLGPAAEPSASTAAFLSSSPTAWHHAPLFRSPDSRLWQNRPVLPAGQFSRGAFPTYLCLVQA